MAESDGSWDLEPLDEGVSDQFGTTSEGAERDEPPDPDETSSEMTSGSSSMAQPPQHAGGTATPVPPVADSAAPAAMADPPAAPPETVQIQQSPMTYNVPLEQPLEQRSFDPLGTIMGEDLIRRGNAQGVSAILKGDKGIYFKPEGVKTFCKYNQKGGQKNKPLNWHSKFGVWCAHGG
jgi:hypothetical protein